VNPDERLTISAAAELIGLSPRALARRMERGTLPAAKDETGRRTISRRELAAAGLLDLATDRPPTWTHHAPTGEALARELLRELAERGVRIADLEAGHLEQAEQIVDLQRQLDEARRERAELRRELKRLHSRQT
jgi:DNA-binding transcriptional MerR regulator